MEEGPTSYVPQLLEVLFSCTCERSYPQHVYAEAYIIIHCQTLLKGEILLLIGRTESRAYGKL